MQRIELTNQQKGKLKAILSRHSTFARFSATRRDAYEYTSILGVRVCPYCNINYTYTVYDRPNPDGSGTPYSSPVCRPDIDHFEPQSTANGLSVAQQNLIPACQQCNSRIKHQTVFSSRTHIHPFQDDFDSIKRFTINLKSPDFLKKESFDVSFADRSSNCGDLARAEKTISDLKLKERYQYHKEDVVDLFRKASFYHHDRVKEIEDLLGTTDLRQHLFLAELKPINESPLAKLKRDVLDLILR